MPPAEVGDGGGVAADAMLQARMGLHVQLGAGSDDRSHHRTSSDAHGVADDEQGAAGEESRARARLLALSGDGDEGDDAY